ncbi:barstar family protein [Aromatoleum toluclasticum]|uniref:barstar family protein n=1 Tax=Aromatoleum toluclasticum TaxID=92003 RepID=UPI000373B715|nr:barstar family protein [Aromatoleum toluclasticum]MCC4115215.1 barstar family protein [Aromatoleum toluclasticum]
MDNESRLADRLRKGAGAGVFHLPADGGVVIAAAAASGGLGVARVDLTGCGNKDEFLRRIATALRFPAWFGHNWDALADCLTDMSWWPAAGHVLILEHADGFRTVAERDFLTALEILEEAARNRSADDAPLWTFVGLAADGIAHLRSL